MLTLGEDNRVIEDGAVLIEGTTVTEIGPTAELKARRPEAEFIDAGGAHDPAGLHLRPPPPLLHLRLRLSCASPRRTSWRSSRTCGGSSTARSPSRTSSSRALIPLARAIRAGTTTLIDHHASPNAIRGSLDVIGDVVQQTRPARLALLRGHRPQRQQGTDDGIDESRAWLERAKRDKSRPPARPGRPARRHDHRPEDPRALRGAGQGVRHRPARPRRRGQGRPGRQPQEVRQARHPAARRRAAAWAPRPWPSTASTSTTREIDLLRETDTIVVHNPQSNMNNAVGAARILDMVERGIRVGLGTDGMTCDMREEVRAALWLRHHEHQDPRVGFVEVAAGAAQDQPGHRLALLRQAARAPRGGRAGGPHRLATTSRSRRSRPTTCSGHVIFGVAAAPVDTTIVDGKVLMRDKKLKTLDWAEISRRAPGRLARDLAALLSSPLEPDHPEVTRMTTTLLTDAQLAARARALRVLRGEALPRGLPGRLLARRLHHGGASSASPADFQRAAAMIMTQNPLGGVCGVVCPDRFCQARLRRTAASTAPSRSRRCRPTIVAKAKALGVMPALEPAAAERQEGRRRRRRPGRPRRGRGPGPAGATRSTSSRRTAAPAARCTSSPSTASTSEVLDSDLAFALALGDDRAQAGARGRRPGGAARRRASRRWSWPTGLWRADPARHPGRGAGASPASTTSRDPARTRSPGEVAVVGGGAIAVDCAVTAKRRGAAQRRDVRPREALRDAAHRQGAARARWRTASRSRAHPASPPSWRGRAHRARHLQGRACPTGAPFHPRDVEDVAGHRADPRPTSTHVHRRHRRRARARRRSTHPGVFFAGDCEHGPDDRGRGRGRRQERRAPQVDALPAQARRAAGIDRSPRKSSRARRRLPRRCRCRSTPTSSAARILSPFLLSAAPPTDGYEQMKKAYEAGWAGGIMKTAFDGVPIHIPADYMFAFDQHDLRQLRQRLGPRARARLPRGRAAARASSPTA